MLDAEIGPIIERRRYWTPIRVIFIIIFLIGLYSLSEDPSRVGSISARDAGDSVAVAIMSILLAFAGAGAVTRSSEYISRWVVGICMLILASFALFGSGLAFFASSGYAVAGLLILPVAERRRPPWKKHPSHTTQGESSSDSTP